MYWTFYLSALLFIAETRHILSKKEYLYTRGGYLFFWGGWLLFFALFFLLIGDIKNWQHWIGFILYLIVAFFYWLVFRNGKTK